MCGTEGSWYQLPFLLCFENRVNRECAEGKEVLIRSCTLRLCGRLKNGSVNSPGAGKIIDEALWYFSLFLLELEKEMGMFSKGKAEVVLRMTKRGGSAKKEW